MTSLFIRLFIKNPEAVHTPLVRAAYGVLAGVVGIVLNLLLCAGKFLIGTLTGSIAIQADAVNNLSDVGSSVVMLIGFVMARRPADAEHPYGHGRVEYVAGLVVAFLILLVGVDLGREAFAKILAPVPVTFSYISVVVLLLSILVKLWMGYFTAALGKRIESKTMAAATTDSRNDVVATSLVLISLVASHLLHVELDGYMGLLAALFVLYSGVGIVKDTLSPLMGEAPRPEMVDELTKRLLSYDGIIGIHDLMLHDYGPGSVLATVHAEVSATADILETHEMIDKAEREIGGAMNLHLTIHMDPLAVDDEETNRIRQRVAETVAAIDERLSTHDFRMVPGEEQINLIFDLVVPYGVSRDWIGNIKRRIRGAMGEVDPRYRCVITVDSDYSSGRMK